MIRRNSIIALAMVALAFASMSFAEAGGGGKTRPAAQTAPAATTRTIVNSTSRSWYTYIYSGTGVQAQTVSAANAQGAKVIAPGGKGVFNVLPNAGGNPFGDAVLVVAVPPLNVNSGTSVITPAIAGWSGPDYQIADYPGVPKGQNFTITVTQASGTDSPQFNPPAP